MTDQQHLNLRDVVEILTVTDAMAEHDAQASEEASWIQRFRSGGL